MCLAGNTGGSHDGGFLGDILFPEGFYQAEKAGSGTPAARRTTTEIKAIRSMAARGLMPEKAGRVKIMAGVGRACAAGKGGAQPEPAAAGAEQRAF